MSRLAPRRRWMLLLLPCLLACGAAVLYFSLFASLPEPSAPLSHAGTPSIMILDRAGRPLYELIDTQGSKYLPLPLEEIPLACQQATIATEDSRFYLHPGVDPIAIARALMQNLAGERTVSGGSTLTQQVARNLYLDEDERGERTLRRKLREAWLAWRLERRYNKNEVLALYLNTTYYGHFAIGIEAAAQAYYGMHARELDLAQCALLAGLPQYPAGYNPLENPEAARGRQRVVLDLMQAAGYVSAGEASAAGGERMAFAASPFPIEAPHFVMWVQSQLETVLPAEQWRQLSLSTTEGGGRPGLKVITTLDLDWQRQAEATVARRLAQLRPCAAGGQEDCDPLASPARRVDDAAVVALDPHTGAVLAMVGSADYFDAGISGAVNAALSLRQPGSAIKPLTYAAALDPQRAAKAGRAPWTPATLIADVRTAFPTAEGQPYVPQNYDRAYHGPVTVRTALANSYNIPAVKTLQHIGVNALIEQAGRMGIGNWGAAVGDWDLKPGEPGTEAPAPPVIAGSTSPARFGLALTLGGGEVRLLDLTAAYAAFANGGLRVTPYAIERIETQDGRVLLDSAGPGAALSQAIKDHEASAHAAGSEVAGADPATIVYQAPSRVLDARVAYLVTNILSDAEARLPAFGSNSVLEIGRPAAAKTGTTSDWRDNWTLGFTPELATGVWAGNADNSPMYDVSGVSGAGPIWHDFMAAALRDAPASDFPRPDGLVQLEVCADSGLLPAPAGGAGVAAASAPSGNASVPCPNRRREWFIAGTEPQQIDKMHRGVALDARTGGPATSDTPPEAVRTETYWLLPDEYQEWARTNGIRQNWGSAGQAAADAGSGPGGSIASRSQGLALSSPDPNRVYRLDPSLPQSTQQLPVTAAPGPSLAATGVPIVLTVDGAPLATVHGPEYTAWWPLSPGRHILQAMAGDGSGTKSSPITIMVNN